MMRKDVEVEPGDHRISDAVLLHQEARIASRRGIIPGAPFIHDQPLRLGGIVLVHDRRMLGHELVHPQCVAHGRGPFVLGVSERWALVVPILVARTCVIVK